MATKNYEVTQTLFRHYPRGSVIPDYEADAAEGLASALREGHLIETDDAVNVKLVNVESDDNSKAALIDANHRATSELAKASHAAETNAHRAGAAETKLKSVSDELANKVSELDRLKALLAESNGKLAAAENNLEAANDLLAKK